MLWLLALGALGCGEEFDPGRNFTNQPRKLTYSATGVSPTFTRVDPGIALQFVNSDSVTHEVAVHETECAELAFGALDAGTTHTVVVGSGPKECSLFDALAPEDTAFHATVSVRGAE